MKSIICFFSGRFLKSLDEVVQHHSDAAEDLRNEVNGNGVKKKFKPRKFKRSVKKAREALGLVK